MPQTHSTLNKVDQDLRRINQWNTVCVIKQSLCIKKDICHHPSQTAQLSWHQFLEQELKFIKNKRKNKIFTIVTTNYGSLLLSFILIIKSCFVQEAGATYMNGLVCGGQSYFVVIEGNTGWNRDFELQTFFCLQLTCIALCWPEHKISFIWVKV